MADVATSWPVQRARRGAPSRLGGAHEEERPRIQQEPRIFCVQQEGQITMEYFVLFGVIGLLTLVAVTQFDDDVRGMLIRFFWHVSAAMGK